MINQIKENIWQLHFQDFGSCIYLLKSNKKNILIDTSSKRNKEELIEDLKELELSLNQIDIVLITHNHWDHIENTELFKKAKIYYSKNLPNSLKEIPKIKIIETPGHTPEDVCFLYKDTLFSGDTIFDKEHNYIGRIDFPESNPKQMQKSLEKLKKIKYKTLCPGHII